MASLPVAVSAADSKDLFSLLRHDPVQQRVSVFAAARPASPDWPGSLANRQIHTVHARNVPGKPHHRGNERKILEQGYRMADAESRL
jgi:hypothetical protein